MTRQKRFDKRYLPMLWIGLAIWLGAMLVTWVMEKMGHAPQGQETLMDLGKNIFQKMPYLTLLLLCLLQPVLEECAFRLWGVGKTWMTIVCLVLMAFFAVSEMGLWGLLFVALFIVIWLCVKNKYTQTWLNTLVTSACFALCHTSGFGGFSASMVLGLLDIFGLAMVLCWLTINLSFWLSCLLHVLNNSAAIILPLLFLPDVATVSQEGVELKMEPLRPFADNSELVEQADFLCSLDSATTEFYLVGEPQEIASMLATQADTAEHVYYDWLSKGENFEERVVFSVKYDQPQKPDYGALLKSFCQLASTYYGGEGLTFDTSQTVLKEIWLVYDDGREEELTYESEDAGSAMERVLDGGSRFGIRGNNLIEEYYLNEDSVPTPKYYVLEHKSPTAEQVGSKMGEEMDELYGYRLDYRDGIKAMLITIK